MTTQWPKLMSAAVVFCLLSAGCGKSGPEKYPVTGKVTYQGQPVGEGTVQFHNPEVGSFGVKLSATGEFSFAEIGGLTAGNYKVYVAPPEQYTTPPPPGGLQNLPPPKEFPNIPEPYRQANTSELSATVKSQANKLDFDMK